MNNRTDLERAQDEHWYRIPAQSTPDGFWKPVGSSLNQEAARKRIGLTHRRGMRTGETATAFPD